MKRLLLILNVLLITTLSGCKITEFIEDNPVTVHILVQQTTARYIESKDNRPVKAQKVIDFVAELRKDVTLGAEAALPDLLDIVSSKLIDKPMEPSDRLLVDGLLVALKDKYSSEKASDNPRMDDLIVFNKLLDIVERTAAIYLDVA